MPSLFGTQQKLTHPPIKTSTLSLRKMPFFRALHLCIQILLYPASSLFGTQQQLTHPPVKSSTLPLRKMPFFRALHLGIQILLCPASSLFGTQQQPNHPLVKSSTFFLRKMPFFQSIVLWHTNFTLSYVIPLWDSATAHSPFGKELSPSSQEYARLSERCTLAYNFHFILRHPSLRLSNNSLDLW